MTGNKVYQDVLQMRRPTLEYVSPAICEAAFSGSSFATLVLDEQDFGLPSVIGLRSVYDAASGTWRISWDIYTDALCYNVYQTVDGSDPNGVYKLVADCITRTDYDSADCPACFKVTAVTTHGETPFGETICNECPPLPPDPPTYFSAEYTASCPLGFTGDDVIIPAGAYTSQISQVNADAKAMIAGDAALVCEACIIASDYYQTYGTNCTGYDPATPAGTFGNLYGQFVIVNNTVGEDIAKLEITFLKGTGMVPTIDFTGFLTPDILPLCYKKLGWTQWHASVPPNSAINWQHVGYTFRYALRSDTSTWINHPGSFTFTSHGEEITIWIGGEPPCP